MRSILIICLFMFSHNGFSQDTLATVLSHHWAAGQCCSGGTDITFTLSDQLAPFDFDSLVYISSNNSSVVLYPSDFKTRMINQKNRCILTYGWSTNSPGNHSVSSSTVGYGLPENRFTVVKNQVPHLLIYKKNEKMILAYVNEQVTITAYP